METALDYLDSLLAISLDAAPWLLFGLLSAGLIKAWVPESAINRWLGGHGLWPITKAALVGAPLPLCSCGVLPAALALHRGGASRGSTVSFLIATPETGADSVALSYALLGPFMTIVRPIAAVISAIFAGLLASLAPGLTAQVAAPDSCGCSCSGGCSAPSPSPGFWQRNRDGLSYALGDILDDIAPWLGLGLLLAALIATFIEPQAMAEWGSGLPAMLVMLLVGVPMYICATASTPLAAALLLAGLSPGTVLVFLLAGPATNIATLAVVRKELGAAVLAAYLAGIAVASIALGLITDAIAGHYAIDIPTQLASGGEWMPTWLAWGSLLLLLLAALRPLLTRRAEA